MVGPRPVFCPETAGSWQRSPALAPVGLKQAVNGNDSNHG